MSTPRTAAECWGDMYDAWSEAITDPSLDHYDRAKLGEIGGALWALSGEPRLRTLVEETAARHRLRLHGG